MQYVLLNNVDHKDLRVIGERSAALGDAVMSCLAFPDEFRDLQAHYPILFQKNPNSGAMQAVALMGLQEGENLFLRQRGWDAHYVPLLIEIQPFRIGTQQSPGQEPQPVIHIDIDSPRISNIEGYEVFLPQGGTTPFLDMVAQKLDRLHTAASESAHFFAVLNDMALLEPLAVEVELIDGSSNRLVGFHTINEDKLYSLSAEELGILQDKGYLQPIYMAVASLSNLRDLVERKNQGLK